jgi:hypothetical protein
MNHLAVFCNFWKLDMAELTAVDWRRRKLVMNDGTT